MFVVVVVTMLVPTEDRQSPISLYISSPPDFFFIAVTGPGKLTVGKLYGGILIYEIWKTTRFSNLEILAKVRILTNTSHLVLDREKISLW